MMRFNLGIATGDRRFMRCARQVCQHLTPPFQEFEEIDFDDNLHEVINVAMTDEMGSLERRLIRNDGDAYQVSIGCDRCNETSIRQTLLTHIQAILDEYPFSASDRLKLEDWRRKLNSYL